MLLLRKSNMDDLFGINILYEELVDYHIYDLKIKDLDGVRSAYNAVEYQIVLNSECTVDYVMVNELEEVVGYMACVKVSDRILIENLVVRSDYRGNGLGKEFIDRIASDFTDIKLIQLNVYNKNKIANRFYKRIGFEIKVESNKVKTLIKKL